MKWCVSVIKRGWPIDAGVYCTSLETIVTAAVIAVFIGGVTYYLERNAALCGEGMVMLFILSFFPGIIIGLWKVDLGTMIILFQVLLYFIVMGVGVWKDSRGSL